MSNEKVPLPEAEPTAPAELSRSEVAMIKSKEADELCEGSDVFQAKEAEPGLPRTGRHR